MKKFPRKSLLKFAAAALVLGAGCANGAFADAPQKTRATEDEIVDDLQSLIRYPESKELPNVREYERFKRTIVVDGKSYVVWNDAVQAALDEKNGVYLPKSDEIYYLDAPILLDSDATVQADPEARIFAVPNLRTCLLRNRHMAPGRIRPVFLDDDSQRDFRLTVTGGIWSQESETRAETFGASDKDGSIPGSAGVFLFSNVADLSITRLKIEKGAPFAVHVSNAKNVFVADVSVETNCDGVHFNGPLSRAVVQNLDCVRTGDDCVALNAWDWPQSAPALGPIDRVLVQNCRSVSGSLKDIRLLPGVLVYPDGTTIDCPISNVVFRNLEGFNYFKMYAQSPAGRQGDCRVGTLDNIYFDNIRTTLQCSTRDDWENDFFGGSAPFSVLSNAKNLTFKNLTIAKPVGPNPCLVYVGPESAAFWNEDADGRPRPVEIFMSDASCVVDKIELQNVRDADGAPYPNPEQLVRAVQLRPNPEYPKTKPRGGVGFGKVGKIDVLP